jgi:hypothetical protein
MPINTLEDLKKNTTYQSFSKAVKEFYQNEYVEGISETYELIAFLNLGWEEFRRRSKIEQKSKKETGFKKNDLDNLTNGTSDGSIDWEKFFEDIQKTQENDFDTLILYALDNCKDILEDHPLSQALQRYAHNSKDLEEDGISSDKKDSREDNLSGVMDQDKSDEKKESNNTNSNKSVDYHDQDHVDDQNSYQKTNQLTQKLLKNPSQQSIIDSLNKIKSGECKSAKNQLNPEGYQSSSDNSDTNKSIKNHNFLEVDKKSCKSQDIKVETSASKDNQQNEYNKDYLQDTNTPKKKVKIINPNGITKPMVYAQPILQKNSDDFYIKNDVITKPFGCEKEYNAQSNYGKNIQPYKRKNSSVSSKSGLKKQASQYNQNDQLKSILTSSLNEKTPNPKIGTDNNSSNEIQSKKGSNNSLSQKTGSVAGLIIGVITGAVIWHFNLQILPQLLIFPNLVILGMIGLVIGYGIDCYSEKNSDLDLSDQNSDQEKKSHLLQAPGKNNQAVHPSNDKNSLDKSYESELSNYNGM